MFYQILIKILIITEVCQSLTINQQSKSYNNANETQLKTNDKVATATQNDDFGSRFNNSEIESSGVYGFRKSPKSGGNRFPEGNRFPNSVTSKSYETVVKSRLLSKSSPYKSGVISNILSQSQPLLLEHKKPVYSYIYPVQYQYRNSFKYVPSSPATSTTSTLLKSNNEPVTAATLQAEILHLPKEPLESIYHLPQPSANYNNKIYHNNETIRNQSHSPYSYFFIRKQRNLNKNHYDDDKLIEHNFTEIRDVNKDNNKNENFNTTTAPSSASLIKQPSSSSHEIRYLHDIFLNYPKSHHANYGHIELSPSLFQKRFESLKAGNRYKGEVISLDNAGGYIQHYWDMALGKL